jgi:hypothetical protein
MLFASCVTFWQFLRMTPEFAMILLKPAFSHMYICGLGRGGGISKGCVNRFSMVRWSASRVIPFRIDCLKFIY